MNAWQLVSCHTVNWTRNNLPKTFVNLREVTSLVCDVIILLIHS